MEILNQFGVQPVLLAAQIVNFLVLLFILKKLLYGPILKVLAQRRETIAQSLKNAQEIEDRLLKTQEDREKELLKAAQEARKIIEDATKASDEIIKDARARAQEDIAAMIKKGEESIKLEKEQMQQEIKEATADIVARALEKVTGKILGRKEQKDIIDRSIKGL